MAETTPNLGLNVWNLGSDFFNHLELEENWETLDTTVLNKNGDTATGKITFQSATGSNFVLDTKVTGDTQSRFAVQADGSIALGSGSSTNYLRINRVTSSDLHGLGDQAFQIQGITSLKTGYWLETNQTSSATVLQNFINSAHTSPTFRIVSDGSIQWGPGSSGPQTTMSHNSGTITFSAPGVGGAFLKANGFNANRTSTLGAFQNFLVDGDANPSIRIRGDGKIQWGAGGASATDTSLARTGSNQLTLESNGTFIAGTIQASNAMSVGGVSVARDSQGLFSGRPAAGVIGRYYYATDEGLLYRDTGSAWVQINAIQTLPYKRVYRTTSFSIPTGGTGTEVEFQSVARTAGANAPTFNLGFPSWLVINEDGVYFLSTTIWWPVNGAGRRHVQIKVNGNGVAASEQPGSSTAPPMQNVNTMYYLEEDDIVTVVAFQDAGSSQPLVVSGTFTPSLTAVKVGL
jgi:hypothetical protein